VNKKISFFFLSLCALALLILAYRSGRFAQQELPPDQLTAIKQADVDRLQAGGGDEAEMAKSLRRMAFQNPEKAAEFARRFVTQDSTAMRAASCEVAGGFPDESWDKTVAECLAHLEAEVRVATLKGMLRQPTLIRRALAERLLAQTKPEPRERLWAQVAVMYAMSEGKDRSALEKTVLAGLEKADRETQSEILIELYNFWPADRRLYPFAEKVLKSAELRPDFLPGFRYMAEFAPDQLSTLLANSRWPDSQNFLLNVEEFLATKCPKGWAVVQKKLAGQPKAGGGLKREIKCGVD